jgi:hypothetical protein
MKKITMFFAALAVAVFSLATPPTKIPTKTNLADLYEPGQLCVCIYFEEEVCNDIVFIGSYNGWDSSDPSSMAKFSELEGFEGWYYVAVTDESAAIEGKPVQLKKDGSFAWDYQGGDAAAWQLISGKVDILDGYSGECDLKNYSTDEPVILTCAYFKQHNSPCVDEVYHNYTIRLNAPFCQGPDGSWFEPAIIGSFNGWTEGVGANDIDMETFEYIFRIYDKEGGEFKFRALGITDWSNQIQIPNEVDENGEVIKPEPPAPPVDENGEVIKPEPPVHEEGEKPEPPAKPEPPKGPHHKDDQVQEDTEITEDEVVDETVTDEVTE